IKKASDLVDLRSTIARLGLGLRDVFPILPAPRIGAVCRGDESQRSTDAVLFHLPQCIGQHGMPVPVSPVDRQLRTMLFEFAFQSGDQFASLLVDWALAVKMVVVFSDGKHSLPGNVSPPKHVLKKRNDVFSRFGTTERDN